MAEMDRTMIRAFWKTVMPQLVVFIVMAATTGAIFWLGRLPNSLYLYTMQLALFLLSLYLIYQYIRFKMRYRQVSGLEVQGPSKRDMDMQIQPTDFIYLEKIDEQRKEIQRLSNLHTEKQQDQLDYFTLWLHQIKTPLSAISLLNQNSPSPEAKSISQEILRLEDYTHMALNYVKLEESGSEMDLTEVDVDSVIKKAVKKYSILFIYQKIKLEYEPVEMTVLSDSQWLQTLLEQILSNSLKYTPTGTVAIYRDPKQPKLLIIEDTGIGIRSEDLPKIFNKGYSGLNGRLHEKSTGLGLFLSKKICRRLGHDLTIQSELGNGTRVSIDLAREQLTVFE